MNPCSNDKDIIHGYYLPHHEVVKTSSLTTKTRVFFGGSCKTTSVSLNTHTGRSFLNIYSIQNIYLRTYSRHLTDLPANSIV